MDRGMGEDIAHVLANDRKWNDVMGMTPREIGEVVGRIEDAAIIIWLKIGGLEVKFDQNDDEKIFLFPKFMGDSEREPVFSYTFGTGNVGFHGDDAFRGLGSLFGDNTIYDWFTPHSSSQHSAFEFANVPTDANEKQKEQLSSLLNMGVMKNILNRIENKVFFDGGFRASINRQYVIDFLIKENPSLDDDGWEDLEEHNDWNGLGSLFG
jgi:hypothetical protein